MDLRDALAVYGLLALPVFPAFRDFAPLDSWNKQGTMFLLRSHTVMGSSIMLKTFVEEAAALTSLLLFVGMIAIWAQVIPQMG
jgi:hypothetical protein